MDEHFKVIKYIQKSDEVFPNTDIKGGVAISLRDANKDFGAIKIFTAYKELDSIRRKAAPNKIEDSLTNYIYIQNKFDLDTLYEDHPEYRTVIGSKGMYKRFRNNIFEKIPAFTEKPINDDDIKVIGLIQNKRVWRYIKRKYVDLTSENLFRYKVLIPRSNGSGALGEVLSTPLIGYTQTFIGFGAFESKK